MIRSVGGKSSSAEAELRAILQSPIRLLVGFLVGRELIQIDCCLGIANNFLQIDTDAASGQRPRGCACG